jgi:hypothetical protein
MDNSLRAAEEELEIKNFEDNLKSHRQKVNLALVGAGLLLGGYVLGLYVVMHYIARTVTFLLGA